MWAFDVNESFHDADIHPSARSAAKAVAWQFNAWLATYRVSNQKPRVVELTGNIGDEFLGEVADVIRRAADRPEVRLAAEATTRPTLELGREPITVAVETVAQAGGGGCVTGGTVNLVARFRANGLFTKAARFVDKPWVENFACRPCVSTCWRCLPNDRAKWSRAMRSITGCGPKRVRRINNSTPTDGAW